MSHDEQRARWNQRFSGEDYLFGTAPNAFLASQRALLRPGQTALAIADGEGRNGVWLAEQGLDVLSIDFSVNALTKARRLAASRGVSLRTEQVVSSPGTGAAAASTSSPRSSSNSPRPRSVRCSSPISSKASRPADISSCRV